jgi:uncharacterized repeat protein (TIGR01451 family)
MHERTRKVAGMPRNIFTALKLLLGMLALLPLAASATVSLAGPPVYVYEDAGNGQTAFAVYTQPSAFNAAATGVGAAIPPSSTLLGTISTFGGSPTAPYDLTTNTLSGETLFSCPNSTTDFKYPNTGTACAAASPSVAGNIREFIAVQSWPFYVGASGSATLTPGTYTFETDTDDGSWIVIAPAAFTYTQPGNFQSATGLTAGTAVVAAGNLQAPTSITGTVTIAASPTGSTCASGLYWSTYEYFEAQGGGSDIEYSYEKPGAGALGQVTQDVIYGQVTKSGAGKSGEGISYKVNGGTATTLTTDANGCYGIDLNPSLSAQSVAITATDTASGQTQTQTDSATSGNAVVQNFAFPNTPNITRYKRITKVVSGGVTTTPSADSGNPTGVAGTVNYTTGVRSGDQVTYTIYFVNAGTYQAQGTTSTTGPTFTDPIPTNTTLVAGSPAFSCCTNPTQSATATLTTGSSVTYVMSTPLAVTTGTNTVQGNFSFTVTIN